MREEKWKELQQLPIEESTKRKIYATIVAEQKPGAKFRWQEPVIFAGVLCLMLFFLLVPANNRTAAPNELRAYVYLNDDGEGFHVFPTALHTGIKRVTEPTLLQQIAALKELQPVNANFSNDGYEVEVLLLQDGQPTRLKLGYEYILNWDTGEVYTYSAENDDLRWTLRDYGRSDYFIAFPLAMLTAITVSAIYYRYKGVKRPKYPFWASIFPVLWIGVGTYFVLVKMPNVPLFKPYIWLYILFFAVIQQWLVQKALTHPVHIRGEKIYVWIMAIVIAATFTYF